MSKKRGRPSNASKGVESLRNDGWANVLTGIGASNSRVNSTRYCPRGYRLDRSTLTDIYTTDGLGRRIVNILVDDAMRSFIHCEGELLDELQRIKSKQRIIESLTWARLYGGSVLVAFVDDGQEMDKPLRLQSVKKLVSLKSYDRFQVQWSEDDLVVNFYDEGFGEPDIYTITPISGTPFRVHRSRLHLFNGERLPNQEYLKNNRWDASVIEAVYDALRNYGQTMNASAEIVQDFIQVVLGINGLTEMLRSGNESLVTNRANIIDLTKSVANTIFLDSEQETYQKQASSVAGLPDLWDRFSEAISAATGIPITKLLGRSPAGLNSTGQNDENNWNNIVDAYRGDEVEPSINWLLKILEAQAIWEDSKRPSNYEWSFPSLKVSNETEDVKNRLLTAQLDQIYIDRAGVDAEFIYKKRYSSGSYEIDIIIDENEIVTDIDNDSYAIEDIKTQMKIEDKKKEEDKQRIDIIDKKEKIDRLASDLCRKMIERL